MWKHDGFEELLAAERPVNPQPTVRPQYLPQKTPSRKFRQNNNGYGGTTQIIVKLPGMKLPITFNEVPYQIHLKLPIHRPPLRRDKPIRISIPEQPIKYIYPHPTRSFVFIPRAMRPGGCGFTGGGPLSDRRGIQHRGSTRSIYGGSIASQSVAMSRRTSSQPGNITQPVSPVQAQESINCPPPETDEHPVPTGLQYPTEMIPEKPTVKLPQPAELPTDKVAVKKTKNGHVVPPLPKNPVAAPTNPITIKPPPSFSTPAPPIHDARGTQVIPMHQPRPQKTVSVADIETPVSSMHYSITNPCIPHPQTLPEYGTATPINPFSSAINANMYTHSRHPSYQSQPPSANTPLSQIPERAVHAQPFQPTTYPQQLIPYGVHYYPSQQAPSHAHPPSHPMYTSGYTTSPLYVPSPLPNGTPTGYPNVPVPPPPQQTIAQESGGTVYFYDPSSYYAAYAASTGGYPGVGGTAPLTPSPESRIGVSSGGTVYYYPTPGTVYYGHQ